MEKNESWQEEAWEELLQRVWDRRGDKNIVEYTKKDLSPILSKYTESGQGEIRIFHSSAGSIKALKKRGVAKLPITRSRWVLFKSTSQDLIFTEPKTGGDFIPTTKLTEGMIEGIRETLKIKSNPGETTMLAIAKQSGLISDFYSLSNEGVMFTGGRQKAAIKVHLGDEVIDMTSAQIEIDGGYEWPNEVVIVEMKSSFKQEGFNSNQALIPLLKWQEKLKTKTVYSLVLLAETFKDRIEYWAYDIAVGNSDVEGVIRKSKKYSIKVST